MARWARLPGNYFLSAGVRASVGEPEALKTSVMKSWPCVELEL